jgi:hypothetical protein
MSQSSRSIKGELGHAVVGGIRQHGADAVGLVLIGLARLLVGVATLGALLAGGAIAGLEMSTTHFAILTGGAAFLNLLAVGRSKPHEG